MLQLFRDQGFLEDPSGNLVSFCPECRLKTFLATSDGLFCQDMLCGYHQSILEYLLSTGKYDEAQANVLLNFYNQAYGDQEKKFDPRRLASYLRLLHRIIAINSKIFYIYDQGVYRQLSELKVYEKIMATMPDKYLRNKAEEVKHILAVISNRDINEFNIQRHVVNFKNGLLDLKTMRLSPHTANFLSTVQLDIEYDVEAGCPLWLKVLDEIFEGNEENIMMLQEFFGYCLVPDNQYQKALINLGEGANGKSLILNTLANILGKQNTGGVSMDQLSNPNYLASLVDKLVNISIESQAKLAVSDSNFKAIVVGDSIAVEAKYGHPFSFRPFCKMIFALNELPRVEDRTAAFYRRIIILKYNRQFNPKEADMELENKLKKQYPGIVNWMILGMKRLLKRGRFEMSEAMKAEVEEFRLDNNPVLVFGQERLVFMETYTITKRLVYKEYERFCDDSGYRPLSIKKFGKELKKNFKINDARDGHEWGGCAIRAELP